MDKSPSAKYEHWQKGRWNQTGKWKGKWKEQQRKTHLIVECNTNKISKYNKW